MTTLVRDSWSDAHQVATAEALDAEVSAVRRRLFVRRAAGLALGAAAYLAAYSLLADLLDSDGRELWRTSVRWPSFSLMGLGLVLVLVGATRTAGTPRPFVAPDAFLSRVDRGWLRTQIAESRPVAPERQEVAAAVARRMVAEGRYLPTYLGLTALYVGMVVGSPAPSTLVTFSALTAWLWAIAVRDAVWARRGRRWLAQHS